MSANFEESVLKEIANKVISGLDKDALAKKMAPKVLKNFEKAVIAYFDDDFFYDLLECSNADDAFKHFINNKLASLFGMPEKATKKRKKR